MKNNFLFLLLILFFQSCQYFEKKVPVKEELLQQELTKINWDEVDEFPTTASCDTVLESDLKKQCLFNFIAQTIQEKLAPDSIRVLYPKYDTLQLKVTVFPDAKLNFESQLTENSTQIDSLLQLHLTGFPVIEPAIKRGIKVKSTFVLPVILKTQ